MQGQIVNASELLTLPSAARRLGVSRQRLHKLITNQQIRAIRLGHYYYLEAVEIERYRALPKGRPHAPRTTDANSVDNNQ